MTKEEMAVLLLWHKYVTISDNVEQPAKMTYEGFKNAITEATKDMWTDEDMYRASRHGVDWVMSEITDELHIERFHQWLVKYKEKKRKARLNNNQSARKINVAWGA